MKAIKRKYLDVDEILRFNKQNNYKIERYFSDKLFNDFTKNKMNLWFDHTYNKHTEKIRITAIYFDYSKKIEKYETIEYKDVFNVEIPKNGIKKINEFSIPIIVKKDTKILWKLVFEIPNKTDFDIHISINGQ